MTTEAVSSHLGPWIASFRDGPLADHRHDRIFSVGPIETELIFMPNPLPDRDDWILVGMESVEPDEPWPGQVRYRVESVVTMAGADGEPVAYYRLQNGLTPAEPTEPLQPTEPLDDAAGD